MATFAPFSGRVRGRDLLIGFLFGLFEPFVLWFISGFCLGFAFGDATPPAVLTNSIAVLEVAALTVTFVFNLSLVVRRLHDQGVSGVYSLLLLIPFINIALFWIWIFSWGESASNKYGKPPSKLFNLDHFLGFRE